MKRFRSLLGDKCGVKLGGSSRSRLRPGVVRLEDRCLAAVDAFIWFNQPSANVAQFTGGNSSKPAFEITDFSFGVEQTTTIGSATGGAGAGKAGLPEFVIKKTADSASPALFANCAAGAHFKTVTIEVPKAGSGPGSPGKPFLQYTFSNVLVTKIDWSGSGDDRPQESVTFDYGKLRVQYEKQNMNGPVGGAGATAASGQSVSIPGLTVSPPVKGPTGNPTSGLTSPK